MKLEEVSLESLGETGERLRKSTELGIWMGKNFDAIFEKAPNNELFAVGVYRKGKPLIHYFNNKLKEVLPFIRKSYKNGKVADFIYRHQSDLMYI